MSSDVALTDKRVLQGLPRELRSVVRTAGEMGWTGRKRSAGGLMLYSPDGKTLVTIPANIHDSHSVANTARDIMRATPPERRVEMADRIERSQQTGDEPDLLVAVEEAVTAVGGAFGVHLNQLDPPPPRRVVTSGPWMARVSSNGAKADLYPSAGVIERVWSDGEKDYLCRLCEDFSSDNPRSVASHVSAHNRGKGAAKIAPPTKFDVDIDGYRVKRTAHLAREIAEALDWVPQPTKREDYAKALADFIVTKRLERGKERPPVDDDEALDDAGILAKIRRMLLREESEKYANAEAEIARLGAELAQAEEVARVAEESARRARETLATLSELAREGGS